MRRRSGVARLAGLYAMVEQLRSLELRVAAGVVDEIACAQSMQAAVHQSEVSGSRAALASGDRASWQVAETARRAIEMRMNRLNKLRGERELLLEDAVRAHHQSRVRMEQMDRVVELERAKQARDESRRSQVETDDRFASRRAWGQSASHRNGE